MDREYITGDQILVEGRDNSKISITDSVVDINRIKALSGSTVHLKRNVKVRVIKGNGDPVSGALVKVTDPQKVQVANGTTNDDGIVQFPISVASITYNQFSPSEPTRTIYGPYTYKALKGIYSGSGTANITAHYNIELELKFPWTFVGGAAVVIVLIIVIVVSPPAGSKKSKKG
jgi:hypothetical protein